MTARGLKEMLDAGGHTLGQDENSCVVYGMPKEAVRHGGVREVAALGRIPDIIVRYGRCKAANASRRGRARPHHLVANLLMSKGPGTSSSLLP